MMKNQFLIKVSIFYATSLTIGSDQQQQQAGTQFDLSPNQLDIILDTF